MVSPTLEQAQRLRRMGWGGRVKSPKRSKRPRESPGPCLMFGYVLSRLVTPCRVLCLSRIWC